MVISSLDIGMLGAPRRKHDGEIEMLQEAYKTILSQARLWSFSSQATAVLGFLVILGGLLAMLLIKGATLGGLIVITSGITIYITAGLLFRQAKDASKQASNINRLIVLDAIDKSWLSEMEEEEEEEEEVVEVVVEEKRRN